MANGHYEAVLNPPRGPVDVESVAGASDGELLAQFAACRDEPAEIAFEALVRRHGPMVLRVCRQILGDRHAAEDAFQATFLILARKAGEIRQPELLGHWLHGVALRTAREARMRDDRRRRRESPKAEGSVVEPSGEAGRPDRAIVRREEFEAIHDEVSRLPERYRIPVVLCDLEGLTHREAAARMRCPVSTIGVRLRRARQRLRARLIRRGLAPTAGLLGILLGAESAAARVPSPLVDSTVQAALGFAAGEAVAAGPASAPVLALAERVLTTMAPARWKAVIGIAMAVGMAVAVGWIGGRPESTVLPVSRQAGPQPQGEVSAPEGPPAPRPAAPRPESEPTAPGNPAATILAIAEAPAGPRATPAPSVAAPDRGRPAEIVRNPAVPARATEPAAAPPRRPPRPEKARGEALFAREWTVDDPGSHGGDGLGPLYNDTSCVACHGLGAPGGAGPESKNVVLVVASPNDCGPSKGLEQIFPSLGNARTAVLHRFSTDPDYPSWRKRTFAPGRESPGEPAAKAGKDLAVNRISAIREQMSPAGRMRNPAARQQSMSGFNLDLVERNTPALFGVGRIDEIPSEVLVALADSQPRETRGRVSRTREGRIGRFGWKAQIPSLHEFVRVACANELGLEVPGHHQAASPVAPKAKATTTAAAKGLDLTEDECDALVSYVRALPAPVVVDPYGPLGNPDIIQGRGVFVEVGCSSCHTPSLGDVRGIYSDLLLHDLGRSLSDSGGSYGIDGPDTPEGPKPREWRTPPLWGYRDSGPYLHDGRAQNLEEAVALHEGQATAASHRFFALPARERSKVEVFLKSLVAPAAAATPGIVLAAEVEERLEPDARREAEELVRRRREAAVARDEQQWREARRRERARAAAERARTQLPLARALERVNKTIGAMNYYREIAREAEGTEEGRLAAERIKVLSTRTISP